ncbi:MAG: hypothetical protein ABIN74_06270 [Ferruginibacter sp.]
MDDLEIALTFDPRHFKELYYQDGQGSVFTYRPTQKAIIYFLAVALFTLIIYLISDKMPFISWLMIPGLLGLLVTGIQAFGVISQYQKWKNDFKALLKDLARHKSYTTKFTFSTIEVNQDSTILIDKWDSIKSAQIYDTYLMLFKTDEPAYIFPAKSMDREDFIKLKDFIINKMKTAVEE